MQPALNRDTANSSAIALCPIGFADTATRKYIKENSEDIIFKIYWALFYHKAIRNLSKMVEAYFRVMLPETFNGVSHR